MSAHEMGPRGPDRARKAQKTPETGTQMTPVGTGIEGDSGNECGNTSVFS